LRKTVTARSVLKLIDMPPPLERARSMAGRDLIPLDQDKMNKSRLPRGDRLSCSRKR